MLQQTIDEFATRVGQQAVVLVATPGKPTTSFKCFGAKPLEDVVSAGVPYVINTNHIFSAYLYLSYI